MAEREIIPKDVLERTKIYAAKLAQWNRRIVEIVAIGDLVNGNFEQVSNIDLICTFDPEPFDDHHGYITVFLLLERDDHERASDQLGIANPIDIGFILRGNVFLPDGEILSDLGEHKVLWSKNNE